MSWWETMARLVRLRVIDGAFAAALLTFACACAGPRPLAAASPAALEDRFVIAGDECGASAFEHLVGEEFVSLPQAALPANALVLNRVEPSTLEYRPRRLNVVLDGAGRIAALGCF